MSDKSKTNESDLSNHSCRRNLQDTFDEQNQSMVNRFERSYLASFSFQDTKKLLKSGAEKMSKTLSQMRITLGTISQRFKTSVRRREILEEGPVTPNPNMYTPQTFSKTVLGHTPTKLYSPFTIDSPACETPDKENLNPMNENHSSRQALHKTN